MPNSQTLLGIRSAKATLDRIGFLSLSMSGDLPGRTQRALELARDALTVLHALHRDRTEEARQVADKLARAAAEFAASLK